MNTPHTKIQEAAHWLSEADALLITTGAGMGVDSGLPDFRGNEGFWRAYPPMKKIGASFTDMANPAWFETKPEIAWGFYGHRLNLYRRTGPHEGFRLLKDLGESKPGGYFIFTSNVDGQFQKAGFDSAQIEECHGSIHHLQCAAPCSQEIWDASETNVQVDESTFRAAPPLPLCPRCQSVARPNILMFGDFAWLGHRSEQQSQRREAWLRHCHENGLSMAIVELGAGKAVPTVRMFSQRVTRHYSARLIRINPRDADVPHGQIGLEMGALEGIQALIGQHGQ